MSEKKTQKKAEVVEPTEVQEKANNDASQAPKSNNKTLLIILGVLGFVFFCCACCCIGFYALGLFASEEGVDFAEETLSKQCDELREIYGDETSEIFSYCD
ncbi:MAG: hypothetical protein KatS3mg086_047 [Candidatus Dojkabacteria bacterium]|nr:MAG: hypothetical protein KatS3mg086_047 [Candidatus Dojkabacteria bacterium]